MVLILIKTVLGTVKQSLFVLKISVLVLTEPVLIDHIERILFIGGRRKKVKGVKKFPSGAVYLVKRMNLVHAMLYKKAQIQLARSPLTSDAVKSAACFAYVACNGASFLQSDISL